MQKAPQLSTAWRGALCFFPSLQWELAHLSPAVTFVMTHLSKVQEYRVIHLAVVIYSKLSLVPDTVLSSGDLRKRGKRNLCRD